MTRLTKASALQAALTAKLAESDLNATDAVLLKLQPCDGTKAGELGLKFATAGFQIPYFTLDGKKTGFYRFRYLEDTRHGFEKLSGEKPTRYVQPAKTSPEAYLPPYLDWIEYLTDVNNELVITEGELKAACACKHGVPTIGLGGVWSFKSKNFHKSILDIFKHLKLANRRLLICFDSDAAINPDIKRAEQCFAKELLELGANVHIARIPMNGDGAKVGLDDYIVAHGVKELRAQVLEGAESFALCERLYELNEEVLVVQNPGFVYRPHDDVAMTATDFKSLQYAHWRYVDYSDPEKPKKVGAASAWLEWNHRATVKRITFAPGEPQITKDLCLNVWKGWGATPEKGDVTPWNALLAHLFGADKESRKWFEQWLAYPIQYPGTKLRNAVAMWGRQTGTGKSLVGYTIGKIYGESFAEISDEELEPKTFNSWAVHKQFVLADDITGQSNRKLANRLKVMITRERLEVSLKYVKEYYIRDCINYYFTSNDPDAFYLDDNDRRYFVHEVQAGRLSAEFYATYDLWKDSKAGIAALMHHMLTLDLTGFNPFAEPPMTASKKEMIKLVKTDLENWLDELKQDPDAHLKLPGDLVTPEELIMMYNPFNDKKDISINLMARKLAVAGIPRVTLKDSKSGQVRSMVKNKLVRLYVARNADKWAGGATCNAAREHYDNSRAMVKEEPKKPKF